MKNNTRPAAAAIPTAGRPTTPTSSPIAPATFRAPSIGSHDRGTCTLAAFARTKPAGMKSGIATAAVTIAVITVTTTYRLIGVGLLYRERSSDVVISLTAFAWER